MSDLGTHECTQLQCLSQIGLPAKVRYLVRPLCSTEGHLIGGEAIHSDINGAIDKTLFFFWKLEIVYNRSQRRARLLYKLSAQSNKLG